MAGATSGDGASRRWLARMVEAAPADRSEGDGPRALLAVATVLAGLAVFVVESIAGEGGGGGHGRLLRGGGTVQYEWEGTAAGWWGFGFPAAGFALLLSAALLRVTRRPAGLAIALALMAIAPVVAVEAYEAKDGAGHVSPSEGRSISVGASEEDVRRILGPPMAVGEWRRGGERGDCLVYLTDQYHAGSGPRRGQVGFFCIDEGRVIVRDVSP